MSVWGLLSEYQNFVFWGGGGCQGQFSKGGIASPQKQTYENETIVVTLSIFHVYFTRKKKETNGGDDFHQMKTSTKGYITTKQRQKHENEFELDKVRPEVGM